MNNVKPLPSDSAFASELGDSPPSLGAIIQQEPRGAAIDQSVALAKRALDVPALPGMTQENEQEAFHRKLVAANLGLNGRQFNSPAKGAVHGTIVGGAIVVAVAIWGAIKLLLMTNRPVQSRTKSRRR